MTIQPEDAIETLLDLRHPKMCVCWCTRGLKPLAYRAHGPHSEECERAQALMRKALAAVGRD